MAWRLSALLTFLLFVSKAYSAESIQETSPWGKTSGNLAITTDYISRGQTQTDHGPAVQAGLDWNHPTGIFANVWGSNVYFPETSGQSLEGDISLGYKYNFSEELSLGLSALYIAYFPSKIGNLWEFPLEMKWKTLTTGITYTPNYDGVLGENWYVKAEWEPELMWEMTGTLKVGYSLFTTEDDGRDYADIRIGLSREVLGLTADVSGYLVSKRQLDYVDDSRIVFTVSKEF